MANRRPQQNGGRRMDYGRNDRAKNFGRGGVSPWQGGGPNVGLPNLLPLQGSTEATLALANNLISNLLQTRQAPVPSLLDMPIRRDFGPDMGRFDHRPFVPNHRMGNQGNFRRPGNFNRPGERNNTNRKPFKPAEGPRHQNRNPQKKEADSKAKPAKESEAEKTESEKTEGAPEAGGKKETPKTRFDNLNPQVLKCHICNKSMWDGRSFENHLSGRAHAIMMQKTAESYALTADTMRQEFKIREMKRTRKTGLQTGRDFYCAMCDMYAADGAVHRTTVGHRKLKKYLHPACASCHKEMPTRIELDEHRLTPEHLKNIYCKQEVTAKPKPEVMVISTLSMEQSYVRDDRQRKRPNIDDVKKEPASEEANDQNESAEKKDDAEDEVVLKTEPNAEAETEGQADAEVDADADENFIVDYNEGDDLAGVTAEMIPDYSTGRSVGRSFLAPFSCVQCRLCRKLLDSQETADVHLRTWRHHQLFVRLLRDKTGQTQDANKRTAAAEEREQSGNWKRRKTTPDHDDDDADAGDLDTGAVDVDVHMKEEPGSEDAEMTPADGAWESAVDDVLNNEEPQNGDLAEDYPDGEQ